MPRTQVLLDGLWRCLCPSFTLQSSTSQFHLLRQSLPKRPFTRPSRPSRPSKPPNPTTTTRRCMHMHLKHSTRVPPRPVHDGPSEIEIQKRFEGRGNMPTAELRDLLRDVIGREGAFGRTVELVRALVGREGGEVRRMGGGEVVGEGEEIGEIEKLESAGKMGASGLLCYDALIAANADAANGSAAAVGELLAGLKREGITTDGGVYERALQVLAIHPDYVLRNEILREMNERWFILSQDGLHNLLVGLLRDRQFEMALDTLEEIRREEADIQPWLYDIFIYVLCEIEEFDEALKILQYRVDAGDIYISPITWFTVLDACSRNFHLEGTNYVFQRRITRDLLNPSDGMCLNILNTAARHASPALATAVIGILAKRQTKLDHHHYEPLLEAYLGAGDFKTSLRLFAIMQRARVYPDEGTTRGLFAFLTQSDEGDVEKAWEELTTLVREGQEVPVSATNVVLEAFIAHKNHARALELYHTFQSACSQPPNTDTFNLLLKNLSNVPSASAVAQFLATEMAERKIPATTLTYDRLILVCLGADDDAEVALRYWLEMRSVFPGRKGVLRRGTAMALLRRCREVGDERGLGVLESLEEAGAATGKMRVLMEGVRGKEGSLLA